MHQDLLSKLLTTQLGIQQLEALGRIFADAFARYTVQVLSSAGAQAWSSSPADREPGLEPAADTIDDAPKWVRQAYERAKRGDTEPLPQEQARRRVARNKLVVAMRQRGMTQAELARRLGKSPTSVSRILRNPDRSRVETIRAIAEALDVDLTEIL